MFVYTCTCICTHRHWKRGPKGEDGLPTFSIDRLEWSVCMCMYKSWLQNHCLWCLQVEYGGGPRSKDLSVSSKHAVCLRVCSLVPRLQVEAAFRLDIRGEYL